MNTQRRIKSLITAVFLLSWITPAAAQTVNWYQIEMIVFTYVTPSLAGNEKWPVNPALSFPAYPRHLEQGQHWHVLDDNSWETALDLAAKPVLPYEIAIDSFLARYRADIPEHQLLAVPAAFQKLPKAEWDLAEQDQRMRWSRDYRVLYHEAWRQPLHEEGSAVSVVISGGDSRGQYSELQGTIQLHASRYLHVAASLWLNGDEQVLPQLADSPPITPSPVDTSWEFKVDLERELYLNDEINEIEYPYRGAVLLEAQRRMRSGEQHYLDHPLFGVLIKAERFNPGLERSRPSN
ncbi:MAG: hypothetical protein ACI9GW_000609 [Halieaceae bacterium]|jgi:hypothetical protein